MSRSKAHHRTGNAIGGGWQRARQAAAALRPAAGKVMPLAKTVGAAARHRANQTRAWAAPQVERAGHVVQDNVAPRVSSLLSAAAQRLEPEKPRRRPWRTVVGISAAAAAASAVAAAVRGRMAAGTASSSHLDADANVDPPAAEAAPAAEARNGQRSPDSDVSQDTARTS